MKISIDEINKNIKKVLGDSLVLNTSSVYEKNDDDSDNLKLVIFFNKLFYKSTSVLYTKLIFLVDSDKKYLSNSSFMYLYDINCIYKSIEFEDLPDFNKKLSSIFKREKFGKNILMLSEFIKSPALLINNYFRDNKITHISVTGLNYDPKVNIVPCKSLFFSFNINLNNNETVELTITKEREGKFIYNFKIYDKTVTVEKNNLFSLVDVIGETLKNSFEE